MNTTYNLAVNLPLRAETAAMLGAALGAMTVKADDLGYPDPAGSLAVRRSIARWLEQACGYGPLDPALMVLTNGARHALGLALRQAGPPAAVLVEERTYQGFRALADGMGIRCVDVAMDEQGMRPDALLEAQERSGAAAVYVQPTLHNPSTITMPFSRRMEIAAVAGMRELTIIEGDVYAPLAWHGRDAVPPFAVLAQGRTLNAGGIGKILGPGLRIGWLLHPEAGAQERSSAVIQREQDGLPTLLPSVVARWMEDGTAQARLGQLAAAMAQRAGMARRIVGPGLVTSAASLHAWLPCTQSAALERRLLARGVRVAAGAGFVGAGADAGGIRLALGAEESLERLEDGLRIVAEER
ncbi:aminotransferase class I/II-fold pyridoxal phosphate-dependent enzyme [Luteibacter yeojuensis]|uniref:PLP-dependent aminotransferase family protein n=1 Tax=Luteibacter yeojuensis TaxID=345309 RepID=A0A7X5TPZ2_9GAMM|nr:PLP-dependent aminotransferase family protein [Luteibacter yeojuensis]NID15244.1 PLP-dependent aminotransferase family protein [Luteibacter yeojuensis]